MPNFLRATHWRLTILYMVIFFISVSAIVLAFYFVTEKFLENHMRAQIEINSEQLLVDYHQDGIDELRHDIKERIEQNHPDRLFFYLRNPSGEMEFDQLANMPEPGWHVLGPKKNLLLFVTDIDDGFRFGVAMSLTEFHSFEKAMRNTFLVVLFATLVLGIIGGRLLSRRFLYRLDSIRGVAAKIEAGQLSTRIPITRNGDDFDQLAVIMNGMLERTEQLIQEVQHVSTSIAHDLRTPLGRIKQKLEALSQNESLDESALTLIDDANKILDESLDTFAALLRISEIESGVRRAGFKQVNLSELLTELVSVYEPVAEIEEKVLKIQPTSNLLINGDRSLLIQLFSNLIENSIRHTPRSTFITLEAKATNDGKIEAVVHDNGPGVSAEAKSHLLKAFYRADSARSTRGSGLGLSLVVAIAKLHDAGLEIENENGFGVKLQFPRSSTLSQ